MLCGCHGNAPQPFKSWRSSDLQLPGDEINALFKAPLRFRSPDTAMPRKILPEAKWRDLNLATGFRLSLFFGVYDELTETSSRLLVFKVMLC